MSVQFGRWNFDATPVDTYYLQRVRSLIAPFGPDSAGCYNKDGVGILYHAFNTTKESHQQIQPCVLKSGTILSWDGRLDNRGELASQLRQTFSTDSPDIAFVAAAYEQWRTGSFEKLIGDWALAAWNPRERFLILAKDFLGNQQLHYSIQERNITWSTILDPILRLSGHPFYLDQEYIAGWLSFFPAAQLTPYVGIRSVPPSSFVRIENGKTMVTKYWDFDPRNKIRYRTDREYEEHFRIVFADSVRRRLRSDAPILAELSGGLDSSSIVCMSDKLADQGMVDTPRLDTVSYYDDSEPNWNERPYFTKVEDKRGQVGSHINLEAEPVVRRFSSEHLAATPCAGERYSDSSRQFAACLARGGHRVLLSGVGGDEVLGGVPTPIPELQELIRHARLRGLARQLKVWALNARRPWFHVLLDALRGFLPPSPSVDRQLYQRLPWLCPSFIGKFQTVLAGYPIRLTLLGPAPNFQQNISTLDALRRQIACFALTSEPPYETRYPYLDRSLLEFLYAIPREQLVRPGQRRSLMRRAMAGIVPDAILTRRRKGFVARSPLAAISTEFGTLPALKSDMLSSLEIVDSRSFSLAIHTLRVGKQIHIVPILRALEIEAWLLHLKDVGLFQHSTCPVLAAPQPREEVPAF